MYKTRGRHYIPSLTGHSCSFFMYFVGFTVNLSHTVNPRLKRHLLHCGTNIILISSGCWINLFLALSIVSTPVLTILWYIVINRPVLYLLPCGYINDFKSINSLSVIACIIIMNYFKCGYFATCISVKFILVHFKSACQF